jgi:hypothetical protein
MQPVVRNLLIACVQVFLMVPLAQSRAIPSLQEAAGQEARSGTAEVTPTKTDSQATKGYVDGNTYRNPSIGVEFTVPEDFQFREPETASDPATGRQTISISAGTKPHNRFALRKYIVDTAIMFVADALAGYPPEQQTEEGYMRRMAQVQEAGHFKRINGKSEEKIGEVTFVRANFTQGKRHHILFAALRKNYAFVFIFVAEDMESAEALIKLVSIKLPA